MSNKKMSAGEALGLGLEKNSILKEELRRVLRDHMTRQGADDTPAAENVLVMLELTREVWAQSTANREEVHRWAREELGFKD